MNMHKQLVQRQKEELLGQGAREGGCLWRNKGHRTKIGVSMAGFLAEAIPKLQF